MSLEELFDQIWTQYIQLNPRAYEIHTMLKKRGDNIQNDHVAYRTIQHPKLGIAKLAAPFLERGYEEKGQYIFDVKKLNAIHLEHEDKSLPKIFISELELDKFSKGLQKIYSSILEQIDSVDIEGDKICTAGKKWELTFEDYNALYEESEYAGWFAAFGFCANHFTVNVNELSSFKDLEDLNSFLLESGFAMNESGGLIKGSADVFLEQSSTMAHKLAVQFKEGDYSVPSCYYEFALRHKDASGDFYQGFVTQSADKIFESTNRY